MSTKREECDHRANPHLQIDGNGKTCGVDCACSQGECDFPLPPEYQAYVERYRRRTDSQPAPPLPSRQAIARQLRAVAKLIPGATIASLAAEILERDERNNAEMIHELVRAGYKDIPARVDATVIRRLLGYVTPGA